KFVLIVSTSQMTPHCESAIASPTLVAEPHELLTRSFSQPSDVRSLQSAKPSVQLAMPQLPPLQTGFAVASVAKQSFPHEPQLPTSLLVATSQPKSGSSSSKSTSLSQLAYPERQPEAWHASPTHCQMAFGSMALQSLPHTPQLRGSKLSGASQPSSLTPLQLSKPAAHDSMKHSYWRSASGSPASGAHASFVAQQGTPLATEHAVPQ